MEQCNEHFSLVCPCEVPTVTATEADLNISDLNDDCLTKIFSYLNYKNLLNLKEAYNGFSAAIDTVCKLNGF